MKNHVTKQCRTAGGKPKRQYKEGEAKHVASSQPNGRTYLCAVCSSWHVTTKKAKAKR